MNNNTSTTITLLVFQPSTPTDGHLKLLQPATPTPLASPTTAIPSTAVQNYIAPLLKTLFYNSKDN